MIARITSPPTSAPRTSSRASITAIAGLGAQERNERLKKAFSADEADQLLASDFAHLASYTVLKHKPVTNLHDIFSAFTVKDLKRMMDFSGVFGGLSGLRKSDLVALVVGAFTSSIESTPDLLASMMPNELEAFRRLYESGGRMDIPLSQRISLSEMPLPAPPLVAGFQYGKTLTLLIPQEYRAPLADAFCTLCG